MEILILLGLTLINGLFSLSEIALISVKSSRIQTLVEQGDRRASTVQKLKADPESFLSAIQVGITLIGIVSGAFGGATLSDDFRHHLERLGFAPDWSQGLSLVLVVGTITCFTIVVGELVPKSIALNNPEKIALASSDLVATLSRLAYPLVRLLALSTQAILKVLRVQERPGDRLSAEELRSIIRAANLQGVLNQQESQAHHNLLRFSEQSAATLMTRRNQVEWIDLDQPVADILLQVKESTRSKFPVARGTLESIVGTLSVRDFLEQVNTPGFELEAVVRPAIVIPESVPAFSVLQLFKKHKQYIALVVDEHGQFEGLLTLHDLTEAIVGDLPDEDEDDPQDDMVEREDGSWLVSGSVLIGDLNSKLGLRLIEEEPARYTTVAGYFLARLERIPHPGSRISDLRFDGEVLDLDGHRIDKVLITPRALNSEGQAPSPSSPH